MSSRPAKEALRPVANRLREVARILGTQSMAAEVVGVSARQMRAYLSAQSEPSVEALAALAVASGTSLEWLLSGAEPSRVAEPLAHGVSPRAEDVLRAVGDSPTALRRMHPRTDPSAARDAYGIMAGKLGPTSPETLVGRVMFLERELGGLVTDEDRPTLIGRLLVLLQDINDPEEESLVIEAFLASLKEVQFRLQVNAELLGSGVRAAHVARRWLKAHALAAEHYLSKLETASKKQGQP